MRVELLKLPYKMDALEPHISEQTIKFHYEKHHQAYVTNTNNLVKGTPLENSSLEELIFTTFNKSDSVGIFDNSAQVFNHTFYWNCMKPSGGGFPIGAIAQKIDEDFDLYTVIELKNKKPVAMEYKSIKLLGDKVQIQVADNKRAQDLWYFALGVGLGEMNARGCGFLNYRWL